MPGIGLRRRKTLLTAFGSLSGVRRATREELARVVGAKVGGRRHRAFCCESLTARLTWPAGSPSTQCSLLLQPALNAMRRPSGWIDRSRTPSAEIPVDTGAPPLTGTRHSVVGRIGAGESGVDSGHLVTSTFLPSPVQPHTTTRSPRARNSSRESPVPDWTLRATQGPAESLPRRRVRQCRGGWCRGLRSHTVHIRLRPLPRRPCEHIDQRHSPVLPQRRGHSTTESRDRTSRCPDPRNRAAGSDGHVRVLQDDALVADEHDALGEPTSLRASVLTNFVLPLTRSRMKKPPSLSPNTSSLPIIRRPVPRPPESFVQRVPAVPGPSWCRITKSRGTRRHDAWTNTQRTSVSRPCRVDSSRAPPSEIRLAARRGTIDGAEYTSAKPTLS